MPQNKRNKTKIYFYQSFAEYFYNEIFLFLPQLCKFVWCINILLQSLSFSLDQLHGVKGTWIGICWGGDYQIGYKSLSQKNVAFLFPWTLISLIIEDEVTLTPQMAITGVPSGYNTYIYIYIYMYCHWQTNCFVVSWLFNVARHARFSELGSRPAWLKS